MLGRTEGCGPLAFWMESGGAGSSAILCVPTWVGAEESREEVEGEWMEKREHNTTLLRVVSSALQVQPGLNPYVFDTA